MTIYRYALSGTAAQDQTWEVSGTTNGEPGYFPFACQDALKAAFLQLTKGNAVYGKPGLGCKGPYTIRRLLIEEVTQ